MSTNGAASPPAAGASNGGDTTSSSGTMSPAGAPNAGTVADVTVPAGTRFENTGTQVGTVTVNGGTVTSSGALGTVNVTAGTVTTTGGTVVAANLGAGTTLTSTGSLGGTVNVGTGVGSSVKEVLDGIERVAGRPVPHELVDRRAGDPVATYADTSVAREVLGWEARRGLDEILATAYRWHLRQLEDGA